MLQIDEVQNIISKEIRGLSYSDTPKRLYEPIVYVLGLGGKRIRPVFTLLACNVFSDDVAVAIEPAIGLEIFHNFTLLHDDIMDRADLRRGNPTVHKKWCDNVAILSGDAMQIDAYKHMTRVPQGCLKEVLDLFSQTAIEVCEGQQYDMDFEQRQDVALEEYLEMIRLKTAVLLAASAKIGAVLGGASSEDADSFYQFGLNLGLAFQLQDDFLDVYGDASKFGKNIGGDILCNKKTYLLITALKLADATAKADLERWLSAANPDPQEKIDAVTAIYNKLDVKSICQQAMEDYYRKAFLALQHVKCNDQRKEIVIHYANCLMQRES